MSDAAALVGLWEIPVEGGVGRGRGGMREDERGREGRGGCGERKE